MIIFAFAGVGKTTFAKQNKHIVDLETSPYKYAQNEYPDLTSEQRKGLKRTVQKGWQKRYVQSVFEKHQKQQIVLVTMSCLLPILMRLLLKKDWRFALFFPKLSLKHEYESRYRQRQNAEPFIRKMLWLWYPVLLGLNILKWCLPVRCIQLSERETLAHYGQMIFQLKTKRNGIKTYQQRKKWLHI